MRKLKLLFKVLTIVIALTLLAVTALVLTFDPNNYKDTITKQVEAQTGRELTIAGDIGLSVFPWVGVKVEDVKLANAEGFSDRAFAKIAQLDVKVKVLPLLRKQLEVDQIRLHGLFASLEVDKDGNNNWSDLAKGGEEKTGQKPEDKADVPVDKGDKGPALAALAVNGIELVDASVIWSDAQNNIESELANFNLTTGAVRFNQPVDIQFNTKVKHSAPVVDADIELTTQLTFNEAFTLITANALQILVDADAPELFKEKLEVSLNSDIQADLDKGQASLDNTRLSAMGANVHAELAVNQLLEEPVITGAVRTDDINARELANKLGVELPPMAEPTAMTRVAYAYNLNVSAKQARLDQIVIKLDNSEITGWVDIQDFELPKVRYELHATAINADAYLPPTTEAPAEKQAEAPAAPPVAGEVAAPAATEEDPEIALPVELLRTLDLQGQLTMESVTITQIPVTDILMKTQARAGMVRVDPLSMKTLEGNVNGSMMLNAKNDVPQYAIGLKASELQAGPVVDPLLVGMTGEHDVSFDGKANLLADIKTSGTRVSALKKAATGQVRFDMGKSMLQGVDVEYYARGVVADYLATKSLSVPPDWRGTFDPKSKTAVYRVRATGDIANGDIVNKDLLLDSSRFRVTGEGVANIIRNDMDFNTLIDVEPTRKKTTAEKLLDEPMKLRIHGPFAALSYDVDKSQLKKALSNMLEAEAKAKVKKELEEEKEELKKKMEDKLKDKLKGLF
jgi:AsmA protein